MICGSAGGQGSPGKNGPGGLVGGQSGNQPGPGANSANAACTSMNNAVAFTYQRPTGQGHCAGEITGRLTNRSSQRLYCRYDFYDHGTKKGDSGSLTIAPGQTVGGEGGGIWSCEADAIKFNCVPDTPEAGICAAYW